MFTPHDPNSPDAHLRPVFPLSHRIRRGIWNMAWLLLCQWTPRPMHFWRIFVLRLFGASIGKNNTVYPTCKIWAPWLLETHDVVSIGPGAEIYNPGGVRLEHHVIVSQDAYLCGATHNYNSADFTYVMKEIVLKPYTWICARAIVLPGICCKEGSVLGAGSVTTKNLAPWTVYAGNPAMPVKERHNFLAEKSEVLFQ
ncbi:putative colanic acid biosynthesis acetyltransferase [uncultured Pontibacter sp.]|uniref:putative colanic acid biosynthesis acetyltransferase n=1 Tax=uncultured Pontibacter sp. TaxID=453356 RepID=UPI002602BF71|nr:putative colanic acid biosynthesis acetyltransferase [uncultured Pontibacter sp.]